MHSTFKKTFAIIVGMASWVCSIWAIDYMINVLEIPVTTIYGASLTLVDIVEAPLSLLLGIYIGGVVYYGKFNFEESPKACLQFIAWFAGLTLMLAQICLISLALKALGMAHNAYLQYLLASISIALIYWGVKLWYKVRVQRLETDKPSA